MPTRSELRTEVRRLLDDTAPIRFNDAQINTWLDMGNSDAITRLGPFDTSQQTGTLVGSDTFSSSEPNYQLATNTIFIKELFLENQNDQEKKIEIVTQGELEARYGALWRDDVAANLGEPQVAYSVDYNVFGLYPRPSLANHGNTWRAFYYRVPSALVDGGAPIFLDALHDCLTWYCVSRGYAQLGDTNKSDWALGRYDNLIKRFFSVATKFANEMMGFRFDVGG